MTDSGILFSALTLSAPIQRALADKAYTHPSPIQAQAIPPLLEGRDLIGIAQTGTGKTAAFALPMLHLLSSKPVERQPRFPRALILTPTRELAGQIADNISLYGRYLSIRQTLIFGGVGESPQIRSLAAGTDIVIATPGRLLDLMEQRHVHLGKVEMLVLDEADRMLDMGFAPSVKRIIAKVPHKRQSLLFSATMPGSIRQLAESVLRDPVRVEVTPVASTVERIDQSLCHVSRENKHKLLVQLLNENNDGLVLIFSRTKHGADRIARNLARDGIRAEAIHGDKSQGARERALDAFREGTSRVLVATDIAARGIDVKGIALVVNYDLPDEPESYVHRIGRTARAGAEGKAISFCDIDERDKLRDIERLIRKSIPVNANQPFTLQVYSQRQYTPNAPRSPQGGQRTHSSHGSRPRQHSQAQAHAPKSGGQRPASPQRSHNGPSQEPHPSQHRRSPLHRGPSQGSHSPQRAFSSSGTR
jgi:ATP-dependent RNA helicase RhlE